MSLNCILASILKIFLGGIPPDLQHGSHAESTSSTLKIAEPPTLPKILDPPWTR